MGCVVRSAGCSLHCRWCGFLEGLYCGEVLGTFSSQVLCLGLFLSSSVEWYLIYVVKKHLWACVVKWEGWFSLLYYSLSLNHLWKEQSNNNSRSWLTVCRSCCCVAGVFKFGAWGSAKNWENFILWVNFFYFVIWGSFYSNNSPVYFFILVRHNIHICK